MSAVFELSSLSYRIMDQADLAVIIAIEDSAYAFPWSRAIFKDCIQAGYQCRVAELNNTVIGYAIFVNAAQECHLLNLCISPPLQGKGYGRQLLAKVLADAGHNGAACVFLEVRPSNRYAMQLYQSAGFNQVGMRKKYYPAHNGREDAVIFARQL